MKGRQLICFAHGTEESLRPEFDKVCPCGLQGSRDILFPLGGHVL